MTDDLEAQARELAKDLREGWKDSRALIAWARRLVAESRAGALREAKPYMKHGAKCVDSGTLAIIRQQELVCTCGRDALAAEAEPGAQE